MKQNIRFFILCSVLLFLCTTAVHATNKITQDLSESQPPKIGNFALPLPQQPGPFFSFGQNIIGKNTAQIYLYPNYLKATSQHYLDFDFYYLYGLSDAASLLVTVPIAADYTHGPRHSSGFSDISAQIEYGFYATNNANYSDQATIITGLSIPTGSYEKNPQTGYGSSSFFLGSTYNRTYTDWLWFASPGVVITTVHSGDRIGSQYLYQLGLGRTLFSVPDNYILLGLLELNGQYADKNIILGRENPNTGGNLIFITPSIWFSTQKVIVQFGFSLPFMQHLYGEQGKNTYNAAASFGWTIN